MIKYYPVLIFSLFLLFRHARSETRVIKEWPYVQDSMIMVNGHVYDSASHEAIGGATITYETLPYGNFIGVTHADDEQGYYEFTTFGNDVFRITVKAENYKTVVDRISPAGDIRNGQFTRDFFLVNVPREGAVIKLEHLIFDLGRSEIKSESFTELDDLVNMMKDTPGMVIQLEGHTDFRGGRTKNLELSRERVDEVKKYLEKKGIAGDRIRTKAFGGSRPLSREASEEAASINRRVEVRIIRR